MGNKTFRGVRNCGLIFIPTPPLPTPAVPNPSLVSPGDAAFPASWGCARPGALWVSFSTTLSEPWRFRQTTPPLLSSSRPGPAATARGPAVSRAALWVCCLGARPPRRVQGRKGPEPTGVPRGLFVGRNSPNSPRVVCRILAGWLRKKPNPVIFGSARPTFDHGRARQAAKLCAVSFLACINASQLTFQLISLCSGRARRKWHPEDPKPDQPGKFSEVPGQRFDHGRARQAANLCAV